MTVPFSASANTLFEATVLRLSWLSEHFVRVTLTGPNLQLVAPGGLDQRVKLLLPVEGNYPEVFTDALLHESDWRREWRAIAADRRPLLRSYTTSDVRPALGEVDIDFFIHHPAGPASAWAQAAQRCDRMLLSAPDSRMGTAGYGIQWRPGAAQRLLVVGDETAFPAIRGIAASLAGGVRARIMLDVLDPADAGWLVEELAGHTVTVHRCDGDAGDALADAVASWCESAAPTTPAEGEDFYAWLATESVRLSRLRERVLATGVAPGRAHSQGYWNATGRTQKSS